MCVQLVVAKAYLSVAKDALALIILLAATLPTRKHQTETGIVISVPKTVLRSHRHPLDFSSG